MKFDEAMKAMKDGAKVTRKSWVGSIYFKMQDNKVHTFQPRTQLYVYDEDIMTSDGWVVEGVEGEWSFYDIIQFLQSQRKARLKDWDSEQYIQYDPASAALIYQSMEMLPFLVSFEAFTAIDWVVL